MSRYDELRPCVSSSPVECGPHTMCTSTTHPCTSPRARASPSTHACMHRRPPGRWMGAAPACARHGFLPRSIRSLGRGHPPTVFTRSNPKGIFDRSDERPTQQQRTARARVPHRSGMDGWRPVMTVAVRSRRFLAACLPASARCQPGRRRRRIERETRQALPPRPEIVVALRPARGAVHRPHAAHRWRGERRAIELTCSVLTFFP